VYTTYFEKSKMVRHYPAELIFINFAELSFGSRKFGVQRLFVDRHLPAQVPDLSGTILLWFGA
jgi:hypothetical protein